MTTSAKVYRDRSGIYVGILPEFPDVAAVGYTFDEARHNLQTALADLGTAPKTAPWAQSGCFGFYPLRRNGVWTQTRSTIEGRVNGTPDGKSNSVRRR